MNVHLGRLCLIAGLVALVVPASTQEDSAPQITLSIFEARVRSFAPGIDAIISLTDEQKKQLAGIYSEVFGTTGVRLADMVLQDSSASVAQRQMATATVLQAQADFRARSRSVFTEEQRQLIDKIYEVFNRVYEAAQEAMVKEVTAGFAGELDRLLTPEQKQAMADSRAEIEATTGAAAEGEVGATQPPDAQ